MQLVEVERVDALLGAHQDVLVVSLRVDPRGGAVDAERAAVENLEEEIRNSGPEELLLALPFSSCVSYFPPFFTT